MTAVVTTVLFTDLVESTALMSRVGQEVAAELRQEAFELMRRAIAESGGNEVKSLGDGMMAVFDSASAALTCGVAIQKLFEGRNRSADEILLVRIGVAAGDADQEDGDFFGVPVVEASRLCARAQASEILTTDVVRALAGSRGGLECESVGALELKGLDQPVPASRVLWTPDEESEDFDVPLPRRLSSTPAAEFVGRLAERERLREAFKAAAAGERRAVFISGEPGIGKTTLATAFAQEARGHGATVLLGRCDEDLGIPYQPWGEALSHLITHAPQSMLEAHVAEHGGEAVRLAPELAVRTDVVPATGGDPEGEIFSLFGAVVDLLGRAASQRPVVLMLDDLHWADRPTVQLLRHVLRADPEMRLVVVGTFRNSEVSGDHPMAELLAALHREEGVDRVPLAGMGDDELLWLLEATAGHNMPPEGVALRDALLAETAGNPFFVGEILRYLAETRAIYLDEDGRWNLGVELNSLHLPVSVREVVTQRVSRLGGETLRVLTMAAVIGRDFDLGLLECVVDLDSDTLLDMCEHAVRAAVLIDTGSGERFTFVHALIEHTLYDAMSSARRARAHRAIAEALEDLFGEEPGERVGELAYHWAAATQPQDVTKAVAYALQAGDRALVQLAPDEAVRWFSQALELHGTSRSVDPVKELDIKISLGIAQRQAGHAVYRDTLLEACRQALEVDNTDALVRATLANNRGFSSLFDVDRDRVRMLETAIGRIDEGHRDEVLLLATLCSELSFDDRIDERLSLIERAASVARAVDDDHVAARAFTLLAASANIPALLPAGLDVSEQAVIRAKATGEPSLMYWAHSCRANIAGRASNVAAHDHNYQALAPLADRLKQPLVSWDCRTAATLHHLLKGEPEEAELDANEALHVGIESGQPDAFDLFSGQFAIAQWQRGKVVELVPLIEDAVNRDRGAATFVAGLCGMLAEAGEDERARNYLSEFSASGCKLPMDPAWLAGMAFYAEATHQLKETDIAAQMLPLLEPWVGQTIFESGAVADPVSYWLGCLHSVLGNVAAAEANFALAADFSELAEAHFFSARTDLAWAMLLLDHGTDFDLARAKSLLESSLSRADAHGYTSVAERARRALSSVSAR